MTNSIGKSFLTLYELKKFRSKAAFAKAFGVSKSAPEHWLSGQLNPSPKHIIKMFTLFPDINKNWFLYGEEPIFINHPAKQSPEEAKIEMLERENNILKKHIEALENIISLLKEKN